MNALAISPNRLLHTGLVLGAALAALTALAPRAHAAQSYDRPASYDVRDVRSSGPVGAVAVSRGANSAASREARCDIRDVCSESPPIAVKSSTERADASNRNRACDTRDICTSTGAPLATTNVDVRYSQNVTSDTVTR